MLRLLEHELTNVVSFENAQVINDSPFTVVSGWNKDSLIANNTSNGSGKSLLYSSLANVFFDSAPLAPKRSSKDMLSDKGAAIRIALHDGKHRWDVTQSSAGISIHRDGKDLEITRKPHQRKKMDEIFPLTEEEFYSYVYIQSQKPCLFQHAKPAERLHYLTSMFDLDVYDKMKKYFTDKLAEVKKKQTEFDVVNSNLLRVTTQMEERNWTPEHKERLQEVQHIVSTLGPDLQSLTVSITEAEGALITLRRIKETKEKLADITVPLTEEEIRAEAKALRAYEKQEERIESYNAQVTKLKKRIKGLPKVSSKKVRSELKTINKKLKALTSDLEKQVTIRKKFKEYTSELEEAKSTLEELGIDSVKTMTKALNLDVDKVVASLNEAKGTLELAGILDDCEDGECPTCRQSVNVKKIRKFVKEAKKTVETCKAQIAAHKAAVEFKELEDNPVEFDQDDFDTKRKEYEALEARQEELEESLSDATLRSELTEQLESLESPGDSLPEPKYTEEQLEELFDAAVDKAKLQSRLKDLKKDAPDTSYEKLKGVIAKKQKKLKTLNKKYNKALEESSNLKNRKTAYRMLREQFDDLTEQLEAVKPIIAKRDYLKALETAYSAKGLKIHAANQILATITQNLNRYSNLIFAEPFKFNVFADAKGVHCIVDRGKKRKASDARLLSGAESDAFRLLWMWAMLVMIDDSKRTNFVVLDEPDSHMDPTTTTLMKERFIPALQSLVDHVILITPLETGQYSDAKRLTVVKHKGKSSLEEVVR
jgi:DNA repair exonuclease SbcCD ATPase subunit